MYILNQMTTIDYNEYISSFFTKNDTEITSICRKATQNTDYDWRDLKAELYLYTIDKQDKILNLEIIDGKDRGLMRFLAQFCYNNIRVFRPNAGPTNFKGKYKLSNNVDIIPEESYEMNEENHYQDKMEMIENAITKLSEVDKRVMHIYFESRPTYAKMAKRLNISKESAKELVNTLLVNTKKNI